MALTYQAIASTTVATGGTASVTFSSIPQTYTDLKLVYSTRLSNNNTVTWYDLFLRFNGTTSGYAGIYVYNGAANSPTSGPDGTDAIYLRPTSNLATANVFANGEAYISNYTSSNYKSVVVDNVTENNGSQAFVGLTASLWSNTAAITSITLIPNSVVSATIDANSTFTLYGIKNS